MKLPPSPGSDSHGQAGLPPEVERLLLDVAADGFVLYCCGRRADPTALVATYEWEHCVDLLTIRDFDRVTAARVPAPGPGQVDVFAPQTVVWAYEGAPQCTLRALLNLVHPHHPDAPTVEYPAPPRLHIPRAEQRPLTIRPPSPDRAGVRAARLAAAMNAHRDGPHVADTELGIELPTRKRP
ncbi:MAG: hypothetical protein ACREX8_20895 [Gammaproteobacteria bacterium]